MGGGRFASSASALWWSLLGVSLLWIPAISIFSFFNLKRWILRIWRGHQERVAGEEERKSFFSHVQNLNLNVY